MRTASVTGVMWWPPGVTSIISVMHRYVGIPFVMLLSQHSTCAVGAKVIPHTTHRAANMVIVQRGFQLGGDVHTSLQCVRAMCHARNPKVFWPQTLQEELHLQIFYLLGEHGLVAELSELGYIFVKSQGATFECPQFAKVLCLSSTECDLQLILQLHVGHCLQTWQAL